MPAGDVGPQKCLLGYYYDAHIKVYTFHSEHQGVTKSSFPGFIFPDGYFESIDDPLSSARPCHVHQGTSLCGKIWRQDSRTQARR